MKNLFGMKKLIGILLACVMIFPTGCGSTSPADDKIDIGIMQFVDHPSLNEIRESFVAELALLGYDESKVTIHYQNGNGDFSNLNTIAQQFVGDEMDLIVAIATQSAQAAAAATSEIPILFSAVSDPVAAGLVESLTAPAGNISGTSDLIDVTAIFDMARTLTPDVKTFGFIYNSGEVNSQSVIAQAKIYCDANGIAYNEATVTNSSEVQQSALQLLSSSDAIFAPIDNTVATAMPNLAKLAIDQKIPVYVAADSMVKDGGLATIGINYTILGKETSAMAVEILEGTDVGTIPVKVMDTFVKVINQTTATALDVAITGDDFIIIE